MTNSNHTHGKKQGNVKDPAKNKAETDEKGTAPLTAEDLATIGRLQSGWNALDLENPLSAPPLQWFEQRIAEHRETMKAKLFRDLSLFLLASFIMIAVSLVAYIQFPLLYLGIQAAAIFIVPLCFRAVSVQNKRKRVNP